MNAVVYFTDNESDAYVEQDPARMKIMSALIEHMKSVLGDGLIVERWS